MATKSDIDVRKHYYNSTVARTVESSPNVFSGQGHVHKIIINGVGGGKVIDSYTSGATNHSITADTSWEAQSFTGAASKLTSAEFKVNEVGDSAATVYAELYAHTGTFGTTGKPTGTALATSDGVLAATFPAVADFVSFPFTGVNQYQMVDGTKYCMAIYSTGGNFTGATNYYNIIYHQPTPTHGGNVATSADSGGSWSAVSNQDLAFKVYGTGSLIVYDSDGGSNIATIGTINLGNTVPGATFDFDTPVKYGLDIYPDAPIDQTTIYSN